MLVAMAKKPYNPAARPASDRKPSGDKKPALAPTLIYRMREHGKALGLDPRLGSVLGVMGVHRELSDAEIAAGFAVAEIYGRYEMLQGLPRRTVASPSYERGFGAKAEIDITAMLPEDLKRHRRAVKKATKRFDNLQAWLTHDEQNLVEAVCCANERCPVMDKPKLAAILNRVAVKMGMAAAPRTFRKTEIRAQTDDGALLATAAVESLMNWFFDRASTPTHFSMVDNPDWKKSRGITGTDGRYHHTVPIPLRGISPGKMDAKLRLACARAGIVEIKETTGEVE